MKKTAAAARASTILIVSLQCIRRSVSLRKRCSFREFTANRIKTGSTRVGHIIPTRFASSRLVFPRARVEKFFLMIADSKLNLTMFSSLDSLQAVEEAEFRMDAMKGGAASIIDVDPRRMLVVSTRFASLAALVAGVVTFFTLHSLAAALVIAAVACI